MKVYVQARRDFQWHTKPVQKGAWLHVKPADALFLVYQRLANLSQHQPPKPEITKPAEPTRRRRTYRRRDLQAE